MALDGGAGAGRSTADRHRRRRHRRACRGGGAAPARLRGRRSTSAPAKLDEVGAGLQVGPNAVKVLRALGLEDALRRNAFEPTNMVSIKWDDASLRHRVPLKAIATEEYGAPYMTAHRADLHGHAARRAAGRASSRSARAASAPTTRERRRGRALCRRQRGRGRCRHRRRRHPLRHPRAACSAPTGRASPR